MVAPMPFDDARSARTLLAALFGSKPDDFHVVLCQLAPVRTTSFTDIGAAAAFAAGKSDVYVHVGLTRRPYAGGARPHAAEIDALGGLWADIDLADGVHKRGGLPRDTDAAYALIRAMGLPPGVIVHSGGGLHVWWPFAEVWTFESDDERRRAQILARAWAITLRERARTLGFTVDMVSDLARLLRVPGTLNGKTDPPRPVRVLDASGATIGEDDALGVLLDGAWEQAEREVSGRAAAGDQVVYGDLLLDPAAEPPWAKLDALRENEPRFDQAWRRKRTSRTEGWSASEWDLALAAYAAQAGWEPQEIANLLIASRRKHDDDLKLRQDYYAATIGKATAGRAEAEAVREAVAAANEIATGAPETHSEEQNTALLAAIAKAIGVEITRVTRSRSEPPVFGIETPYGSGSLGSIKAIIDNSAFRAKVGELTSRLPKRLKAEQWDPLAQALLQVAELDDLGVETTLAGKAETLVSLYLGNHGRQAWDEMSDKARLLLPIRMEPFIGEDGVPRLFASGFKAWLAEHQHEILTRTEIATMLKAWGATPETRHFGVGKGRTTRSLWRLPDGEGKGVDG